MRKKFLVAAATCLLLSITSNAQSLMHSFGGTVNFVYDAPGYKDDVALSQTLFTYFPRVNVAEYENSAVSVGVPLSVGVGLVSDGYGGFSGAALAFDVPAVIDLNFGAKSSIDNESNFGGYFGVGAGYQHTKLFRGEYAAMDIKGFGPLIRAGLRFGFGSNYAGQALTLGGVFKKGSGKNKINTAGINVLWDF